MSLNTTTQPLDENTVDKFEDTNDKETPPAHIVNDIADVPRDDRGKSDQTSKGSDVTEGKNVIFEPRPFSFSPRSRGFINPSSNSKTTTDHSGTNFTSGTSPIDEVIITSTASTIPEGTPTAGPRPTYKVSGTLSSHPRRGFGEKGTSGARGSTDNQNTINHSDDKYVKHSSERDDDEIQGVESVDSGSKFVTSNGSNGRKSNENYRGANWKRAKGRGGSRFTAPTPSSLNASTRSKPKVRVSSEELDEEDITTEYVRKFRPDISSEIADLSSLTAVDLKDFSFGRTPSRRRRPVKVSTEATTTTTKGLNEGLKTGPRTLPQARKLLDGAQFGKFKRLRVTTPKTESFNTTQVNLSLAAEAKRFSTQSPSKNETQSVRYRKFGFSKVNESNKNNVTATVGNVTLSSTLRPQRKVIRRLRPTSRPTTTTTVTSDDAKDRKTVEENLNINIISKIDLLEINKNLTTKSYYYFDESGTTEDVESNETGFSTTEDVRARKLDTLARNLNEEDVDPKSTEEEDDIKLSESNIRENSQLGNFQNGNVIQGGLKPGHPLRIFRPTYAAKTSEGRLSTEPNVIVRTRKIIRKLKPTGPPLTKDHEQNLKPSYHNRFGANEQDNNERLGSGLQTGRYRFGSTTVKNENEGTDPVSEEEQVKTKYYKPQLVRRKFGSRTENSASEYPKGKVESERKLNKSLYVRRKFTTTSTTTNVPVEGDIFLKGGEVNYGTTEEMVTSTNTIEKNGLEKDSELEDSTTEFITKDEENEKNYNGNDDSSTEDNVLGTTISENVYGTTEETTKADDLVEFGTVESSGITENNGMESETIKSDQVEDNTTERFTSLYSSTTMNLDVSKPLDRDNVVSKKKTPTSYIYELRYGEIQNDTAYDISRFLHNITGDEEKYLKRVTIDENGQGYGIATENITSTDVQVDPVEDEAARRAHKIQLFYATTKKPTSTTESALVRLMKRKKLGSGRNALNSNVKNKITTEVVSITRTEETTLNDGAGTSAATEDASESVTEDTTFEFSTLPLPPESTIVEESYSSTSTENVTEGDKNVSTNVPTVEYDVTSEINTSTETSTETINKSREFLVGLNRTVSDETVVATTEDYSEEEDVTSTTAAKVELSTTRKPNRIFRPVASRPKLPKRYKSQEVTVPSRGFSTTPQSVSSARTFKSKFRFKPKRKGAVVITSTSGYEDEEVTRGRVKPLKTISRVKNQFKNIDEGNRKKYAPDGDSEEEEEEEYDEEYEDVTEDDNRPTLEKPSVLERPNRVFRPKASFKPTNAHGNDTEDEVNKKNLRKSNVPYNPNDFNKSFSYFNTSQREASTRPHRKFTTTTPTLPTQDLSDIDIAAISQRNKNLFSKTRKMNTPFVGVTTESAGTSQGESDRVVFTTTGNDTQASSTTEKSTTLTHIFTDLKYDSSPDYNETDAIQQKNNTLEKLIEVSRVIEVYAKQEKVNNGSLETETLLETLPKVDKIGTVNRLTVIKLANGANDTDVRRNQRKYEDVADSLSNRIHTEGEQAKKPFRDVETSTIPLEGLFRTDSSPKDDANEAASELLEGENSNLVQVRIRNRWSDGGAKTRNVGNGNEIPTQLQEARHKHVITMKAEVVEVTPANRGERIRIVPVAVSLRRKLQP